MWRALSPTLFNNIIDWILGQAIQDYPGVQVGENAYVSDLTYADAIVILCSSYSEMQGLLEAANHPASAVRIRINASKTNVTSAFIPGEQRQVALLDGEFPDDIPRMGGRRKMVRAPRRSEAGLILPIPHFLACNPVFGLGVKYHCAQRAGSSRQ